MKVVYKRIKINFQHRKQLFEFVFRRNITLPVFNMSYYNFLWLGLYILLNKEKVFKQNSDILVSYASLKKLSRQDTMAE